MLHVLLLAMSFTPPPLRSEPAPKAWKAAEFNEGLPYRWEAGTVHLLAWETTSKTGDIESTRTQILVLKRFDKPTEKGGHLWVLAHLYHHPEDKDWPWRKQMLRIPPVPVGQKMPDYTDAQVFGHEFYNHLPTDRQIAKFLNETGWPPDLGEQEAFTIQNDRVVTLKYVNAVTASGVDKALWKKLFQRPVNPMLFPDLWKFGKGDA